MPSPSSRTDFTLSLRMASTMWGKSEREVGACFTGLGMLGMQGSIKPGEGSVTLELGRHFLAAVLGQCSCPVRLLSGCVR
jgi:hypothetical protein